MWVDLSSLSSSQHKLNIEWVQSTVILCHGCHIILDKTTWKSYWEINENYHAGKFQKFFDVTFVTLQVHCFPSI